MHELTNKNVANTQWAHLHIYAEKKTQMNGGQAIQNKFRFYKTKNKCDMTKQHQNKDKRKQRNKQKITVILTNKKNKNQACWWSSPLSFHCVFIFHTEQAVWYRRWCKVECDVTWNAVVCEWCNYGWNHTATHTEHAPPPPPPPPKKIRNWKGPKSWQWEKYARLYSDLFQALKGHFQALGSQRRGP